MNDSACSLEQSRFLSIQFLYCLAKPSVLLVLNPHIACANLQFGWFNPQVLMASSAPSLRGGNEVDGPVGAGLKWFSQNHGGPMILIWLKMILMAQYGTVTMVIAAIDVKEHADVSK